MDRKHIDRLRNNRVKLVRGLYVGELLLTTLLRDRVLTDCMKETIDVEPTKMGKAGKLLDILPRRGPDAYKNFIRALVETEQFDLAEMLDSKLYSEIQGQIQREETGKGAKILPSEPMDTSSPVASYKSPSATATATAVAVAVAVEEPASGDMNSRQLCTESNRETRQSEQEMDIGNNAQESTNMGLAAQQNITPLRPSMQVSDETPSIASTTFTQPASGGCNSESSSSFQSLVGAPSVQSGTASTGAGAAGSLQGPESTPVRHQMETLDMATKTQVDSLSRKFDAYIEKYKAGGSQSFLSEIGKLETSSQVKKGAFVLLMEGDLEDCVERDNLEELANKLGYVKFIDEDLKRKQQEIRSDAIRRVAEEVKQKLVSMPDLDGLIVMLICHSLDELEEPVIRTTLAADVADVFSSKNLPSLLNRPKVFIVQFSVLRGPDDPGVDETDDNSESFDNSALLTIESFQLNDKSPNRLPWTFVHTFLETPDVTLRSSVNLIKHFFDYRTVERKEICRLINKLL